MSKTKTKTGTSRSKLAAATPRPEQLAAVRRLAESGQAKEARLRLAALKHAHPDFKPLYALGWEIEMLAGQPPVLEAARAWQWHQVSPSSRPALEALRNSTRRAGLVALHACALQRLRSLDLDNPAPLELAPFHSPIGPLSPEQAEANDVSRMLLAVDEPAAAAAVLRGMDHAISRNNRVVALFSSGDTATACAEAEAAWQADPDNLFVLERTLRLRCWQQGLTACSGFAATLRASAPRRPEDATACIAALRFLGDAEGAQAVWRQVRDQTYWATAAPEQRDLFQAQRDPEPKEAELPGNHTLWLPLTWTDEMRRLSAASRVTTEAAAEAGWNTHLDTCDAHADYLQRAGEQGNQIVRLMARAVLKRRARQGDPAALAAMMTWLTSMGGPDAERMQLLEWLNEENLRDRKEPAPVRIGTRVQPIVHNMMNITSEPRPQPYSQAGTALADHMFEAMDRHAWAQAHELALQLHAMHPELPATLTNLASIKQAMDEPVAAVRPLFEQALTQAPDYLFARCGLAACLANEGHIEEARPLLDGLNSRTDWHVSEYRAFLLAQRALVKASGEPQALLGIERALVDLQKNFGS